MRIEDARRLAQAIDLVARDAVERRELRAEPLGERRLRRLARDRLLDARLERAHEVRVHRISDHARERAARLGREGAGPLVLADPREAVRELQLDVRAGVRGRRLDGRALAPRRLDLLGEPLERRAELLPARVAERAAAPGEPQERRQLALHGEPAGEAREDPIARGREAERVAAGEPREPHAGEPQRAGVELLVVIVEPALDAMRIALHRLGRARGERGDPADGVGGRRGRRERGVERGRDRGPAELGGDPRVEPRVGRGPGQLPHRAREAQPGVAPAPEAQVRAAELLEEAQPLRRVGRRVEGDERLLERHQLRVERDLLDAGRLVAVPALARRRRGGGRRGGDRRRHGLRAAARGAALAARLGHRVLALHRRGRRPLEPGRHERREVERGRAQPRRELAGARVDHVLRPLGERRERDVADPLDAERPAVRGRRAAAGGREPRDLAGLDAEDRAQPLAAQRRLDDRAGGRVDVGQVRRAARRPRRRARGPGAGAGSCARGR